MNKTITTLLQKSEIGRLDAELLLAQALECERSYFLAHGDEKISEKQEQIFHTLIQRRKRHEPIAYIIGEKEFYGRQFFVDKRVLIPRPATETLIDEVKLLFDQNFEIDTPRIIKADTEIVIMNHIFLPNSPTYTIVDVGTGSGCIAITLALEIPNIQIIATDISEEALEVAKKNADKHNVTDLITFIHHDIRKQKIDSLDKQTNKPNKPTCPPKLPQERKGNQPNPTFLLVSNPPYISQNKKLQPDVCDYEPHEALFSGDDGMNILTELIKTATQNPLCIGFVFEMPSKAKHSILSLIKAKK